MSKLDLSNVSCSSFPARIWNVQVSIVIPCYNGGRYLCETLESAVAQSRTPLEVIVVDDGSTDESAAIAESFGPPVRVFRQANQGESVARNLGIAQARGTHVLFLDADDLLRPEALGQMIDAVGEDPVAVALSGWAVFDDSSREIVSEVRPTIDSFFPTIISRNPGVPHSYLTPLAIVRKAGGFCESMKYFEDWDFWCQVALAGGRLVPVEYVAAVYRRHAGAQTRVANQADRKLGHVTVVERTIREMLRQPALVEAHGESAFWAGWTALLTSRGLGIPWLRLNPLATAMYELLERGPRRLRSSRFGRIVRLFGFRAALALQAKMTPPPKRRAKRVLHSVPSVEVGPS